MANVSPVLVTVFSVLFGLSSWIAINGLWVETPILVNRLPEGWKLASYITVITQLANVGILVYSLLRHYISSDRLEVLSIHVIYTIGTIALILLIFFWDHVSIVGESKHSVVFFVLTFFLAIVDCTSSVLYLPFMSRVPARFVFAQLIGQALSGLVPSFLALIQGVGGNPECIMPSNSTHKVPYYRDPRFSIEAFLIMLILLILFSWVGFICLSNLNRFFRYRRGEYETAIGVSKEINDRRSSSPSLNYQHQENDNNSQSSLSAFLIALYLITMSCIAALINGILPAIQPYSVLYYGNTTYHFVVTLAAIASPVGCLLAAIGRVRRWRGTLVLALITGLATASYIITAAVHCPVPLIDHQFGKIAIVIVWITNNMSFSLSKATIVDVFRTHRESNRFLFFDGLCSQAGSTIGAFVMFYIVNYTQTFKAYNPCSDS